MPSCYKPPLPKWKSDLSKGAGPGTKHYASYIACATDNYLEIYRKRKIIVPYFTFFLFASIEPLLIFMFFDFLSQIEIYWFMAVLFFFVSIVGGLILYVNFFTFLFYQFAPASSPIRFNRKTGKVYLYEAVVMERMLTKLWPPLKAFKDLNKFHIKVYDWKNFNAVLLGSTVVNPQGGSFERYALVGVACEPNSYKVIEYIYIRETDCFTMDWDWICHFMEWNTDKPLDQAGLEYIDYHPRDAETFMQVKPRLKITSRQIEGLDKASKAGSKEELAQIEQEYELTKPYIRSNNPDVSLKNGKQNNQDRRSKKCHHVTNHQLVVGIKI
ncbi:MULTISPECIES: DUF6708 domain-containing protein [unclassified Gilliamella]|nr:MULTISPECIES: DUF6708 domain-containing protein [unclassified Gilliamella]MCX8574801.1 hypothetical protein [Gilliamella sp. B3831]MCX8577211.1 hypothetical protein [Gilliamella sp. B3815]MCX8590597.1 hypothetical protein [Gilliamella sp. B3812]MCX8604257.1 hypothetical protein [Gilliamella sp. B3823]MCX8637829.1 hypothetical protein [Gilliamella sp. B3817]